MSFLEAIERDRRRLNSPEWPSLSFGVILARMGWPGWVNTTSRSCAYARFWESIRTRPERAIRSALCFRSGASSKRRPSISDEPLLLSQAILSRAILLTRIYRQQGRENEARAAFPKFREPGATAKKTKPGPR